MVLKLPHPYPHYKSIIAGVGLFREIGRETQPIIGYPQVEKWWVGECKMMGCYIYLFQTLTLMHWSNIPHILFQIEENDQFTVQNFVCEIDKIISISTKIFRTNCLKTKTKKSAHLTKKFLPHVALSLTPWLKGQCNGIIEISHFTAPIFCFTLKLASLHVCTYRGQFGSFLSLKY